MKNIYTSFILYHHSSMSEDDLIMTISTYVKQKFMPDDSQKEIIVLLDGIRLREMPLLNHVISKREEVLIIESDEKFSGPGMLWNKGFNISKGERICFTWTGVFWLEDSLFHLNRLLNDEKIDAAYGPVRYEEITSTDLNVVGQYDPYTSWIQGANIIPLCYTLWKRKAIIFLQGFYNDPNISKIVDWEFLFRAVTVCEFALLKGTTLHIRRPLRAFPFKINSSNTLDDLIRYIFREERKTLANESIDLNQSFYQKLDKADKSKSGNPKWKIAIISGFMETAQVQLCIMNYLEQIMEHTEITWRKFLEVSINPEELQEYDVVFYVRSRTNEAVKSAKYCYENNIKTIYVLDDNWFCAVETYPQLENQIGPQTEAYKNFLILISTVDCVWVYNEILKEDLGKYNDKIHLLPVNVNFHHFEKSKGKKDKDKDTIHIGFAGSSSKTPYFGPVFLALEKILAEYTNTFLFIKGIILPEVFEKYKDRINMTPYIFDYRKYAKEVSDWECDIMISPLGDTKYINSKCPNKYLEITASGAVGIYTKNQLYSKVIQDGVNGVLVENNEESWCRAIENLILNEEMRREIFKRAYIEVKNQYGTKKVLPQFISLLETIVGKSMKI